MGGNGRDRYFEGQKEAGMERRVSLIFRETRPSPPGARLPLDTSEQMAYL